MKKRRLWVWIGLAAGLVCLMVLSCCCFTGMLGSLNGSPAPAVNVPKPSSPAGAGPSPVSVPAEIVSGTAAEPEPPFAEPAGAPSAAPQASSNGGGSGPTARQERLALALWSELADHPNEDEEGVVWRVARRERVSQRELNAAYVAVISDEGANQRMIGAYNAGHGLDARGNRRR